MASASASASAPAHVAPDEDAPDLRTPQGVDLSRARLEDPDWRVRVRALGVMATALAPLERAIDAEALAELRHEDAAFREELSGKLERDRDAFVAVGDAMGWSSHGPGTRDLYDSSEETTREEERLAKTRSKTRSTSPDARAELDGGRRSRGASPAQTGADPSADPKPTPASSAMASPRKRSGGLCGCGSAADAAEPTRVAPPSGARAVVESADAKTADAKTADAKTADAKTADAKTEKTEKTEPASETRDVRARTTVAAETRPDASGVVSERFSEPDRPEDLDEDLDEDPPLDPAAVTRLLHACAPCVARAVGDLREDVRVAACGAIKAACDAANERVELSRIVSPVAAEVFAPALLRVASREADPAASNAAFFALVRCASACAEPSFLRCVCDAYARCRGSPSARRGSTRSRAGDADESPPRNELLRRRALELVARVLADWPSRVLTDENADCLPCATMCVLDGLEDPSAEVRRAARACFEVYEAVWPRRAEALVFELRPHARQLVLGGSLAGDPGDARNGAGSRWALARARPPGARRGTGALPSRRSATRGATSEPR